MKNYLQGKIAEAFSDLAVEVYNAVKIVVEAVVALVVFVTAVVFTGYDSDVVDIAKNMGEDILKNPGLKMLSDILMVVAVIFSGGVMAAFMIALYIAAETGGMDKVVSALANFLHDTCGVSKEWARVIADVIVMVATVVVGVSLGKLADKAIKLSTLLLFAIGSILGSSTLSIDILKATGKKDEEWLAILVQVIQSIVSAVTAAIGGFKMMTQSMGSGARAAGNGTMRFSQIASRVQLGTTAIGGMTGVAQGGQTIMQGKTHKKLTEYQANAHLSEVTQENINTMIHETGEELKRLMKGYEILIGTAFKTTAQVANAELEALIKG